MNNLRLGPGSPYPALHKLEQAGFRITLEGVATDLAGALALSRLLASLLFQVSAINPLIFASAAVLLVGMAILASFLPARRATRIDPMQALRAE